MTWVHWRERYPSFDHYRAAICVDIGHDLDRRRQLAAKVTRPLRRITQRLEEDPGATWPIVGLAEAIAAAEATADGELIAKQKEALCQPAKGRARAHTEAPAPAQSSKIIALRVRSRRSWRRFAARS